MHSASPRPMQQEATSRRRAEPIEIGPGGASAAHLTRPLPRLPVEGIERRNVEPVRPAVSMQAPSFSLQKRRLIVCQARYDGQLSKEQTQLCVTVTKCNGPLPLPTSRP